MLSFLTWPLTLGSLQIAAAATISLPITTYTISDSKSPLAVYYGQKPTVFSPNITGLYSYQLPTLDNAVRLPGDLKSVTTLYGSLEDYVVTLVVEDSLLSVTSLRTQRATSLKLWGDYSAICAVGSSLVYIFGKGVAKVVMVQFGQTREIADIPVPVEAEACVASSSGVVYFGGNDGIIYSLDGNSLQAAQTAQKTSVTVYDEIAGLAIYEGGNSSYLFVSVKPGTVEVYSTSNNTNLWSISFSENDVELEGIAMYQKSLPGYPDGAFVLSFDEDPGPKGPGVFPLSPLGLPANKRFDPRASARNPKPSLMCLNNGFQASISLSSPCICFTGFTGPRCAQRTCINNCSSRGSCTGPNTCQCNSGWTGSDCSFKTITATYETSANGGDGDDPAIWIHPVDKTKSRIITTTKSEEGAGFALFNLEGKIISQLPAGEPNNVDVIYGFKKADGSTVDLAAAGCRDKDTICLVEVKENELTSLIDLPLKKKFKVYGSCVYRSPVSGKSYIFVNSKKAEYLQYELLPSLEVVLVRSFTGGSGGQVEGCVVDDENQQIIIGEEPFGLWRYSAEPDAGDDHVLIDSIKGNLFPDVEGVTLVRGLSNDKGLIIVSCQGVSAYNIYRRATHEFVGRFTIQGGVVDKVTNTDGVTAVSTNLGVPGFESGMLVVHDDVNTAPDGSRDVGASFKIVGLGEIVKQFNLSSEVDPSWNPRK